jgi:hypothetical protein
MSANRRWTVALRPTKDQPARKITKVIGLNGDGFSVLAPYHMARSGFLFKLPVDPTAALTSGTWVVPWNEVVGFTVEDRTKLTYHTDGFAQFSSERPGTIISGRDATTGEPKGLGLFAPPFTNPIWTGPSASVTVWGLEDFEMAVETDKPLLFDANDFYYRGIAPDEATSWGISIYVFPVDVTPPVRFDRGEAVLDAAIEGINGAVGSVVRMKVIHLREERVLLGMFVNAFKGRFPTTSGWLFGGPGDWTANRRGHVLKGVFPRELVRVEDRGSLDRDCPGGK